MVVSGETVEKDHEKQTSSVSMELQFILNSS